MQQYSGPFVWMFLIFLCLDWKANVVNSFVQFQVVHQEQRRHGASYHDHFTNKNNKVWTLLDDGTTDTPHLFVSCSRRSSKTLVLLYSKKSNKKNASGKRGGGGGGGGGFGSGTLSNHHKRKSKSSNKITNANDDSDDDDDYTVFPRLEPNVQKTLVESTREDREHAKDLSVEMYQRLDQIYGFPDFNFPPDWFDDNVGEDDNKGVDNKKGGSSSWQQQQDLLMSTTVAATTTTTDQPSWMSAAEQDSLTLLDQVDTVQHKGKDNVALDEIQNLPPFTKFRVLHVDPMVLAIDDFFTQDECDQYIDMCCRTRNPGSGGKNVGGNDVDADADDVVPILSTRSKTVGKDSRSMAQRTSTTWFHHYRGVPALMAKASRLMGLRSIDRWEEPQTVRYQQTEKFTWHLDALAPSDDLNGNGGQRVATLLVYLSDVGEKNGGSTVFRDLRCEYVGGDKGGGEEETEKEDDYLKMIPKKGSALLFFPAAGGVPNTPFDIRTLHAGEAMAPDAPTDKWIAQLWLRENELYKPNAPPGNSREMAFGAIRDYCGRNGSV
jgi:hypothetical protein